MAGKKYYQHHKNSQGCSISLGDLNEIYRKLRAIFYEKDYSALAVIARKQVWLEATLRLLPSWEKDPSSARCSIRKILIKAYLLVHPAISYSKSRKVDILLLTSPKSRWQKNSEDTLVDPYSSLFIRRTRYSIVSVRRQVGREKSRSNRDTIFHRSYLADKLKAFLLVTMLMATRKAKINSLSDWLFSKYNLTINLNQSLRKALFLHYSEYFTWKEIILRHNPSLAIIVCSYDNYAFIHACKDSGIKTIELQHGQISDRHFAYHNAPAELFADYFFAFGQYWLDNCKLPIHKSRQIVVGNPQLSLYESSNIGTVPLKALVIMQPKMTVDDLREIRELTLILQSYNYQICLKPHPLEPSISDLVHNELSSFLSCPTFSDPAVNTINEIIKARVVIGCNSTCLIEASALGKISVSVSKSLSSTFKSLIDIGAIHHLPSKYTLPTLEAAPAYLRGLLYLSNPEENFASAIKKVLE